IDLKQWRDALTAWEKNKYDNIWKPTFGVAAVQLVRQTRDPQSGQWGPETTIPMVPGYPGMVSIPEGAQLADAAQMVSGMRAAQETIIQPEFVPTVTEWNWPTGEGPEFSKEVMDKIAAQQKKVLMLIGEVRRLAPPTTGRPVRTPPPLPAPVPGGAGGAAAAPPAIDPAAAAADAAAQRAADLAAKQAELDQARLDLRTMYENATAGL